MSGKGHRRQKTFGLGALIAIGALVGGQGCGVAGDGDRFKAVSPLGCRRAAWTPEVFSFYGAPKSVMDKLSGFDMKLADRRMYMYMVESTASAELVLYERPAKGSDQWQVWRWKGTPSEASKIREEETNQILARQGNDCVGLETQKLVELWKSQREQTTVSPVTAAQAFGDVMARYPQDSYIRATMFLLC